MNNLNLPPEKMDILLKMASQKLGRDPSELKAQLENGNVNQAIGNLDPKMQGQISALLNNPQALEVMLQNEKLRNLINGFMSGQK